MAEEVKPIAGAGQPNPTPQGADEKKVLTITEDELEKKLQSEADKRVASALKTAQEKWRKESEETIKNERADAERLAKMSEEEKARVQAQKREDQLTQRERELHRKELQLEAVKILNEKGLPVTFAEMLIGETAEDTMSRINTFKKEWDVSHDKLLTESLRGKAPQADDKKERKLDMNEIIRNQARRK
jgi:hypothetical protein